MIGITLIIKWTEYKVDTGMMFFLQMQMTLAQPHQEYGQCLGICFGIFDSVSYRSRIIFLLVAMLMIITSLLFCGVPAGKHVHVKKRKREETVKRRENAHDFYKAKIRSFQTKNVIARTCISASQPINNM